MDVIHTQIISPAGEDILLLMVSPNWQDPMSITYQMQTDVRESLSGVEHLSPMLNAPLLSIAYTATTFAAKSALLRAALGGLAKRRVAIPLWMDALPAADWAGRIHDAQWVVGFNVVNGEVADVAVTPIAHGTPAGAFRAPLVVGYLEDLPDARTWNGSDADWRVKLVEDSPWNTRIQIAGSPPSGWSFSPDWTDLPVESLRRYAAMQDVGNGREKAVHGSDMILHSQRARLGFNDRAGIKSFLSFWQSKRAMWKRFLAPAWFAPSSTTPTSPLNYTWARFSDDKLTVDYADDHITDLQISLTQTLEESIELPFRCHVYKIWSNYDTDEAIYLTDSDLPITYAGQTWTPARIEHRRPKQTLELQSEGFDFTGFLDDLPTFNLWVRGEIDATIWVEVHDVRIPAAVEGNVIFKGRCKDPRFVGKVVHWKSSAFAGFLDRQLPRFNFSRSCQHALFGAGCKARRPTEMGITEWVSTGGYDTFDPTTNRIDINIASWHWGATLPFTTGETAPMSGAGANQIGGAAVGDYYIQTDIDVLWQKLRPADPWAWEQVDWFAAGWIETGAGMDLQRRGIVRSTINLGFGSGDLLRVYLDRPFRLDLLDTGTAVFSMYPGCDGRFLTCGKKFANGVNFGGQPFAPAFLEEAPYNFNVGGK